jgi:hypothetical protein
MASHAHARLALARIASNYRIGDKARACADARGASKSGLRIFPIPKCPPASGNGGFLGGLRFLDFFRTVDMRPT